MKKAAIIGFPVKHSLSPKLHNYWLRKYNIDAIYGFLETEPSKIPETISLLRQEYIGANVTVPNKEAVMQYLDNISDSAKAIGAVNTIINREGVLTGDNTDAYGFIQHIKETIPSFSFQGKTCLVLGAGGAAKAVIYGLIQSGVEHIFVSNRTASRAYNLIDSMATNHKKSVSVIDWNEKQNILNKTNLLVNSTTLGMTGQPELDFNIESINPEAVVYDIVYKPLETSLLKAAKSLDIKTIDGLGMLLHQGAKAFEIWFGTKPKVDSNLREFILANIS